MLRETIRTVSATNSSPSTLVGGRPEQFAVAALGTQPEATPALLALGTDPGQPDRLLGGGHLPQQLLCLVRRLHAVDRREDELFGPVDLG